MAGRYTSARVLTEAGMAVGITVILSLLGVYVPMFYLVAFLVWPLPPALLGLRHGMRWSVLTTSATVLLLVAITGPVIALGMGLSLGPMGIFLGEAFRQRWSGGKMLLGAMTVFLLGFALQFALLFWVMDIHLLDMYYHMLTQSTEQSFQMLERMYSNPIELDQARQYLQEQQRLIRQLEPFMILSMGLLIAFLNIRMARWIFGRLRVVLPPFPEVADWEMPRAALYLYVAATLAEYFGAGWGAWVLPAALNIKAACMYVIWIQGLAVLFWLGRIYPMIEKIKWLLLVIGIFLPVGMAMLFIGGLFDLATNYRKNRQYR